MFKSEKLVRITIQVPEPYISAATAVLSRFRLLHLIRMDETHLGRLGYAAETDGDLLREYDALLKETEGLLELLQARPDGTPRQDGLIPEKEVFKIRERLSHIRHEVHSALGDLTAMERTRGERDSLLDRLRLLPAELDLGHISNLTFAGWAIGLLPEHGPARLEESLSPVHHALIEMGTMKDRAVVLVFGMKKDWAVFERALKGARFEPVEVPSGITGTVGGAVSHLESEISALDAVHHKLTEQRGELQRRFGRDLFDLRERIMGARQVLTARRFFGKIDKSFLISGWVPERLLDHLEEELQRVTERQVLFEKTDPEEMREVREGIVKIPILFNNPILVSPFEKLTSLYGAPRYREVEPTVFFALSFLLLFGMMFGDVGQGAVLFLLGYFIFRRFYRHVGYGIILMECGLVSALFGLLYGSVFGLENVIPALWFRPMEDIPYFVKAALCVGIALVSLGLVLNVVNAVRLKEYEILLGASGIGGTLLYWIGAGLAMKYFFTGEVSPRELRFLGWTATGLLAIMILYRPLFRLLKRHPSGPAPKHTGLAAELIESIVEVFDGLLGFVANTVSFIRVAAFALSHTALFVAVFSIAGIVSREKGTGISYWLVVVAGNIVIILLEGLVVSIQTVRLEYYEFLGKFFRGGGEKFKPFAD